MVNRMNVLVILLSGQHIPNLLSVEAVKPDKIAYVETEDMKKSRAWSNLEKALEISNIKVEAESFQLKEENSINAIKRIFTKIKDQFCDDDITVNLTGGTKLMSIGAYDVFKDTSAQMIYKPFRYVNEFVDLEKDCKVKFKSDLSIRQFLRGYGYEISESDEEIENHLKDCSILFDLSLYIAENHNINAIRGCISNLTRINAGRNSGDLIIDISDGLRTSDVTLKKFLVGHLGMRSLNEEILHGRLSRKVVRFLTGEWLEIFIWGLLDKFSMDLGFRNPLHSLTILKRNESGVTKNELDVVFLKGTKFCIVECKTGKQNADEDASNVIYKLKSIMEQTRALDVGSYLVTTSDNIIGIDGNIKRHIASRMDEYGVNIIQSRDVRNFALAYRKRDFLQLKRDLSKFFK